MSLPVIDASEIGKFYHGDVSDYDTDFVQNKLDEAVDRITTRGWKTLVEGRIASGLLTEHLYKSIVFRAAGRALSNPDGFRKENEGQYGYERFGEGATGDVDFTAREIADLTGIQTKASGIPSNITMARAAPTFGSA